MKNLIKKIIGSNSVTKVMFIKFQNARRKLVDKKASALSHISRNDHHSKVFDYIYQNRFWRSGESISGYGSTLEMTANLRPQIEKVLRDYKIKSLLDLPCGDFHWMKTVNFGETKYIGGEIVQDLVDSLNEKYKTPNISFQKLDLVSDNLPETDMIFVRDCLIHLRNDLVLKALQNIARSNIKYLFVTHSTKTFMNADIENGQFREVNLCKPPFNLPAPLLVINEGLSDPLVADKSMAIWEVSVLRAAIKAN